MVLAEMWADSVWVNYALFSYTYDANGDNLSELDELWSDSGWVNDFRYTCTYDVSGQRLAELREYWEDSLWVNWFHDTFSYDALGNPTTVWSYRWVSGSWVPNDVTPKGHRVHIIDGAGNDFTCYGYNTNFTCKQIVTGVGSESANVPATYSLSQNYPNPFNPTTTIQFDIPKASFVTLKVYNILGQEVLTALDEQKVAGRYDLKIDATSLPSRVYFYQLTAGDYKSTKKFVLLK